MMSDFKWDDHPVETNFNWDDHPVDGPQERSWMDESKEKALAALQGFGNATTMGYLPHLQAATQPMVEKLMGVGEMTNPDYVSRRDEMISRQEDLKNKNPISYGAGSVGGVIGAGLAIGPLAGAPLATAGGRIAAGASQGLALAAASNPGDVEGEVDNLQLEDRLKNGGIGLVTGGLASGAVEGIAKGAKSGADYFKKLANEKAVKAAGGMKGDLKALGPERVQAMGNDLLENDIVTPFARPKDIAQRVDAKQTSLIARLDEALKKADSLGEMNMETATPEQLLAFSKLKSTPEDLKKASVEILKSKFGGAPASELEPGINKIDQWMKDRPDVMTAGDLQKMKTSMNPFLDTRDFANDMAGMPKEGLKALRSTTRQAIEDKANYAADVLGENSGSLKETNRQLGSMFGAEKFADNAMARDSANRAISLTDTIAGAGGLTSGGPIAGAAMAAGNKLLRSYGDPLAATGLKSLSNGLMKIPKFAAMAQNNPEAFQSMVSNFSNSPKFKAAGAKAEPESQPYDIPQSPMGKEHEPSPRLLEVLSKNPDALQYIKNPKLKEAVQKYMNKSKDPRESFLQGN